MVDVLEPSMFTGDLFYHDGTGPTKTIDVFWLRDRSEQKDDAGVL